MIRKRCSAVFLALGVFSVAGMFFIYEGDWILASVLFILANIGANGSFVFYDALLPHVAREDEVDRVSTAGYACSAISAAARCWALNLAWYLQPAWFGLPRERTSRLHWATLPTRLAFLSVAVWWLVFSIPLFRRVSEPAGTGDGKVGGLGVRAAVQVCSRQLVACADTSRPFSCCSHS